SRRADGWSGGAAGDHSKRDFAKDSCRQLEALKNLGFRVRSKSVMVYLEALSAAVVKRGSGWLGMTWWWDLSDWASWAGAWPATSWSSMTYKDKRLVIISMRARPGQIVRAHSLAAVS